MIVSDYATRTVQTVHQDETVQACAAALERSAVGCLIVLDAEERPVGIVTDRDLTVRALAGSAPQPDQLPVHQVMSEPLEDIAPGDSVENALNHMRTSGHRRLAVCDEGKVVGLLSIDDVLDILSESLHELATEMPEKRRQAIREARVHHAREDLEDIYDDVRDKLRKTSWYSREVLFNEIDSVRERLKKTLESMDMHLP
ncbi:MAG: CBS domain-containing protein [bacterium]|nr:CBS domain-containing protein [bacterium]